VILGAPTETANKNLNHPSVIGEMDKLKIGMEFELAQPTNTLTIFLVSTKCGTSD
jgi:hypothetical protein